MAGRKRLREEDTPAQQFAALRQVKGLSIQDCRSIVSLLGDNDYGKRTCSRMSQKYTEALPCLREITVPMWSGKSLSVPCMSLPAMLQAKIQACPFYATNFAAAARTRKSCLNLILYADEAHGGNVLAATHARKATLVYASFVDLPVLHLESQWLTLAVIKHNESQQCVGGLAAVLSELMSFYRQETLHGFAVDVDQQPTLVFVSKVCFLADHEGVRAAMGCKGAAGIKPCVKCRNVLSGDRCSAVAGHVGIVETDFSKFWPMTQTEVDESVRILQSQPTQARLEEAEKLLGWNWTSLERSCLNRSSLRGWFDVEYIHFDSMHAYWSNGIIAQELGLWYDKVTRLGAVTLDHLQAYVDIGWRGVPGTNAVFRSPKQYFTDKLFRKGVDYRGDAQFVLAVLPLCVAFGEELLRGRNAALDEALDSLVALQNVSVCILDSKVSVTFARPLHVLQQEHMRCFVKAYGAHVARPKLHYATHLKNQCEEWNRMIDCFVCERKHRAYKTLCGNQVLGMNKAQFTKTALLQLAQQELNAAEEVERFHTRQLGNPKESKAFQSTFRTSQPAWLSTGLEHQAVRYVRGQFLLLGKSCAVEIHASVKHQDKYYLLVETLEAQSLLPTARSISKWKAVCHSTSLLEVNQDFNIRCVQPSWIRRDSVDTITLLR